MRRSTPGVRRKKRSIRRTSSIPERLCRRRSAAQNPSRARPRRFRQGNFCCLLASFQCRNIGLVTKEAAMSNRAIGIAVMVLVTMLSGAAIGKGGGGGHGGGGHGGGGGGH